MIEKNTKFFTKKIEGMENLNYHQRLKKLNLYSMERRRERFLIMNGWQQLEGLRENVLKLKTSERSKARRIQLGGVKFYRNGGARILPGVRTQILNSPARKVERLFNHIPSHLRNITGKTTEYFKKMLDEWLMKEVPDQPKCGNYKIAARSNSIIDQYSPGNRVRI